MNEKSIYHEKPWVKSYSQGVPAEIEIPVRSVNELFDEATERWKDRTALVFYGKKISYRDLRDRVDRFAAALFALGIRKGDRVAFLLLNCPEFIIAFYGVLKAGGVITPISPVYSSSEVKHQLEDSGAVAVICQDILYENIKKTGMKFKTVILTDIAESLPFTKKLFGKSIVRSAYQDMSEVDGSIFEKEGYYKLQALIKEYPPNPPSVDIDPEKDVMVLPYTSGTTGLPKGVMITHFNVVAHDIQFYAMYPFLEDGKDSIVSYMPYYHAAGQVVGVLQAVLRGTLQVIMTTPEIDDILYSITRYNATYFAGVPTIYETLKDYEKTDRVEWKDLKLIFSGADNLFEDTAKGWKTRTGVDIHNNYGQTEVVALSHMSPLGKGKLGSVGIPVPNMMSAILDPDEDGFLPLGEIGEIAVNGPIVTPGYWKKPDSTKECESVINGERWWRTGDLGMMDRDGYFFIYDRKRDLIKYKGLRIYAREVEEVLKDHPKIREAGVIGVPDIKVGQNVKASVVLESDARGKLSEMEILEYCKEKLAHYKVPKILEFVGELPKTDVGKVSRREIREAEGSNE